MHSKTFVTKSELGFALARHVLDGILGATRERFILGVPTGSTPMPFFEAFISIVAGMSESGRRVIADKLYLVAMDDFVDPATEKNIPATDEWSAVGFLRQNFVNALQALLSSADMAQTRILFPESGQVGSLKRKITSSGGIDMQIIATDPYEGHVGQNFAGEPFAKSENEKCAPLGKDFLKYHEWAACYRGVTFGLDDFMDMVVANRHGQFLLMLWGEPKHAVLQRFIDSRGFKPQLPLSFLWLASDRTFVFSDYEPASKLAAA